MKTKILVTGALGQIGTELVFALRKIYGADQVIATDIRMPENAEMRDGGPFEFLDVLNANQITRVMQIHSIGTIYHMAALLSAIGETRPNLAWDLNMNGLYNMLESARQYKCSLFFPSSIGAFGPETPLDDTPQLTIQRPKTMYGITKVSGELLCDYYYTKFGVDTRGVRFPGLISYLTRPGGGTTDYAVEIFRKAKKYGQYTCYLKPDTSLDMMYMPDAIKALIGIMDADPMRLKDRNAFNITAMHFTPEILAGEIKKTIPNFEMSYDIDPVRQAIADSWPNSMNDSAAREQWDWNPEYSLDRMVSEMLEKVQITQ